MGKATAASVVGTVKGGKTRKKGKKGRKIGRYSKHPSSMRYKSERRWTLNQRRRVRRHLKRCPADGQARSVLDRIGGAEDRAFLAALPKEVA